MPCNGNEAQCFVGFVVGFFFVCGLVILVSFVISIGETIVGYDNWKKSVNDENIKLYDRLLNNGHDVMKGDYQSTSLSSWLEVCKANNDLWYPYWKRYRKLKDIKRAIKNRH